MRQYKIAVIGNCQLKPLIDCLNQEKDFFTNTFIDVVSTPDSECLQFLDNIQKYDSIILIKTSDNYKEHIGLNTKTILSKISINCLPIVVPCCYYNGYFPTYNSLQGHKTIAIDSDTQKIIMTPYHDYLYLVLSEYDISDFDLTKLSHIDVSSLLLEHHTQSINELTNREKSCNIKISELIQQTFRKFRCFYTYNHPCNFILQHIYMQIYDMLSKRFSITLGDPTLPDSTLKQNYQHHIYDFIARGLSLNSNCVDTYPLYMTKEIVEYYKNYLFKKIDISYKKCTAYKHAKYFIDLVL
jgi:hypothetical protein